MRNAHSDEILWLGFMEPMGLTQNALARAIHDLSRRINELVHCRRAVTDLRLARYLGLWEGFSACRRTYELLQRRRERGDTLAEIEPQVA